jgi:hypothetical protein
MEPAAQALAFGGVALPPGGAPGGGPSTIGARQQAAAVATASTAATPPPPPPAPPPRALLYTDCVLRACGDGAAAGAHRGVLAAHSRVLADLFASGACDAPPLCVVPLPGKTRADLDALLAFMYPPQRDCDGDGDCARVCAESAPRLLALAAEYDMPSVRAEADAWLAAAAAQRALLVPPLCICSTMQRALPGAPRVLLPPSAGDAERLAAWVRWALLAQAHALPRFGAAVVEATAALGDGDLAQLLRAPGAEQLGAPLLRAVLERRALTGGR